MDMHYLQVLGPGQERHRLRLIENVVLRLLLLLLLVFVVVLAAVVVVVMNAINNTLYICRC